MLGGEYRHTLDPKGRVSIPAKFRNELGDVFVISKGIGEKCLFIFTVGEWQKIENKIRNLPLSDRNARQFTRYFVGGASECEIDKQGRVMIPPYLREYASLKKDVVVIGATTRVEIWDADLWNGYMSKEDDSFSDMLDSMRELGI